MKRPPPQPAPAPATPPVSAADLPPREVERLELVLSLLIDHHEVMLRHTREHKAALGTASAAQIALCVAQQHADAQRFAELESARTELFRAVSMHTASPGPKGAPVAAPPATLSALLARIAQSQRARVVALASRLKALVVELEAQRRALRLATESLLGHMQGLISHVARALSPTGTYARPNMVNNAPQVVSGLDLTS